MKTGPLVLAAILLAGCTVINPHVEPDMAPPSLSGKATQAPGAIAYYGDLPREIDYARSWRAAYYDAIGAQSRFRNLAGAGLLAFAGGALGLAASGSGAGSAIVALTGAGGVTYVASQYFPSNARQLVYAAGMDALSCVISDADRFLMPKATSDILSENLTLVSQNIAAVGLEKAVLDALILAPGGARSSFFRQAEGLSAAAGRAVADAATEVNAAAAKLHGLDTIGSLLRERVNVVVSAVSQQIVKTEPDPSALKALIGTLGGFKFTPTVGANGSQPAGGAPTTRLPAAQVLQSDDIGTEIQRLGAALASLNQSRGSLQAAAAQVPDASLAGDMTKCSVASAIPDLALIPAGAFQFTQGVSATQTRAIANGKRPYTARLRAFPVKGVSVNAPGADGNEVSVAVTADALAGTTTLDIQDATGLQLGAPIVIAGVPPTPRPQPQPVTPGGGPQASSAVAQVPEGIRDQEKPFITTAAAAAAIQKNLCVKGDAKFGNTTRAAIRAFQDDVGDAPTGTLTAKEAGAIKQGQPCSKNRLSFYEVNDLTQSMIGKLRTALKLNDTPQELDASARTAIANYKADHVELGTSDIVTRALLVQLQVIAH
jgi:hypothetical protein